MTIGMLEPDREPVIYRTEVLAIIGALSDLVFYVRVWERIDNDDEEEEDEEGS